MAILNLALKSVWNRKFTALLTVLTIAISVALLLGVEKTRTGARSSFTSTLSGIDLIVGARSGPVQLLLYSVFRIGNATNNITWDSYQALANDPNIAWTIPISLGDSHRGFRVMGTDQRYFEHYRYARDRSLHFAQGRPFGDIFEAVLGADVAAALGYRLDQSIVISHGLGATSFSLHDDKPFKVVGILAKTGTPVDRTVHVSLQGLEAIHIDWQSGTRIPGVSISAEQVRMLELQPKTITAVLVKLKSRIATFQVQRMINEYPQEPLLAILPGVALQELWDLLGVAEQALLVISVFVVLSGLLGMITALLTSLNERRREMAILRSVGARPGHIFGLLMAEAGILTLCGVLLGVLLLYLLLLLGQPLLEQQFGLFLPITLPNPYELGILSAIIGAGFICGAIPALQAYRYSLADGLTVRV